MRKRMKKIVGIVVGVIALACVATGLLAYRNFHRSVQNMHTPVLGQTSERNSKKLLKQKKPLNILFLRIDTGNGRTWKGRSDTIMMLSINPQKNKTVLMSVPRDAAVVFPSFKKYGVTKINSAYTLGGVAETAKTLDKYYRVPIDGYIEINMSGLKKLVQQIGGVDVTALASFTNKGYTFKKGQKYHLNGDKALAYTQIRREDNRHDYGRQERIRQVMMAILKSVKPSTLLNDKLMKLISKEVRTDFHINQMYRLAVNYRHATNNIVSDNVQGTSKLVHNKEFGDMVVEEISLKERQRASDLLRKNLNLPTVKLK